MKQLWHVGCWDRGEWRPAPNTPLCGNRQDAINAAERMNALDERLRNWEEGCPRFEARSGMPEEAAR